MILCVLYILSDVYGVITDDGEKSSTYLLTYFAAPFLLC